VAGPEVVLSDLFIGAAEEEQILPLWVWVEFDTVRILPDEHCLNNLA
jgi:hypothetical protein